MKKVIKILKYIGISIIVIFGLFIFLLFIDSKNNKDSYNGSINHITNEWCNYGYDPNNKECCDEDDYSCEMIDRGAMAECNDDSFSFSLIHKGTCSNHKGVNIWFK